MSTIGSNAFLASLLTRPHGGRIDKEGTFRRYTAIVRTLADFRSLPDSGHATITYEVGARSMDHKALLAAPAASSRLCATYSTRATLAEDYIGLSRKYTNFSSTFATASLAGLADRISKGLAVSSLNGKVGSLELRAGQDVNVFALDVSDRPVSSLVNCIFLPRLVGADVSADVFSVLVNAAAGEGASVATDVLGISNETKRVVIPAVGHEDFPYAAIEALRIVGENMIAADQGPLFSLAVTKGLHSVLSVVGHTDEGGITRDLLRSSSFDIPHGGIHYGLEKYVGLPTIASSSPYEVSALVDGLSLATAALVAHCDPCVEVEGRLFPTVYSGCSSADALLDSGLVTEPTDKHMIANRALYVSNIGAFAREYSRGLGVLFGASGNTSVAETFLQTSAVRMSNQVRHLRYASVAPYYWIEPTSLLPVDMLGSRAESAGFGALADSRGSREKPFFEGAVRAGGDGVISTQFHVKMRTARTSGLILHLNGHALNGLGSIGVRQIDPTGIVHAGGDTSTSIADRVESDTRLGGYLWTRGQSCFPAPSELINLRGVLGLDFRHCTLDAYGTASPEHLPAASELTTGTVSIAVSVPAGIENGTSNYESKKVSRARTAALRQLMAASTRNAMLGGATNIEMPISLSVATDMFAHFDAGPDASAELAQGVRRYSDSRGLRQPPVVADEQVGTPKDALTHHGVNSGPSLAKPVSVASGAHVVTGPAQREVPLAISAAPLSGPNLDV